MPDSHQIFKTHVPDAPRMCKGVAVMRRRADSWLNATQILKVAGFDKPQRTRVLEREVQKGEHEKVQGGYGKYQGTWIPLERGLQLAKQYNCEHMLRPIIDFQPAAKSPPLAPKHLVTAAAGRPARRAGAADLAGVANTRAARKGAVPEVVEETDVDMVSTRGSEDGSMTPSPSEVSSSSRTPSPIRSTPDEDQYAYNTGAGMVSPSPGGRKRRSRKSQIMYEDQDRSDAEASGVNGAGDSRSYGDQILEYFISDSNQIPPVLISPPADMDPNMAIDDEGHTALHWACAMGRIRIVKFLLSAGADVFKVNKSGQTALMRSVMFANNYDVRKFPELYELLHRSTLNIDNYNRTVFHHIVDVAMSKGKTHAARYYMETVLNRLADYPRELADIINFQDEDGETALTMAARCRSKRLVKILIDHGADPKIANRDNKSTEDYILEDERFRSSPVLPSRAMSMSFRNAQAAYPPPQAPSNYAFAPANGDKAPLHYSVAGQKAATRAVTDMASLLDSLAASFDQELRDKERDLNQAHALLSNIQAEILESQRSVGQLKMQSQGLLETKQQLQEMEEELNIKMGKRYRLGWEKWVKDEEEREKAIREATGGSLAPVPGLTFYPGDEAEGDPSLGTDKRNGKRKAPMEEDVSDLLALHANIGADPETVRQECEALREELGRRRKRRKEMFDEFVRYQAEAGTGARMADYRRLIAAGCGGLAPAEVDGVLGMLLEVGASSVLGGGDLTTLSSRSRSTSTEHTYATQVGMSTVNSILTPHSPQASTCGYCNAPGERNVKEASCDAHQLSCEVRARGATASSPTSRYPRTPADPERPPMRRHTKR
ncbi:apses-domain-containing protein [Artomyces pyxidatus]|uniref:Apses-domain-containing protein n=1 Tax=Artomyces pyxidatus TaxID=48021 RepID=A0ACB8TL60_9AGAM|nr:apses-domain-containing protein [Artomyces pyxidatus]